MARHPLAFRAVVARRGRIDPGELILRIQGLRVLAVIPRLIRLLVRGKINPLRTLLGLKTPAARAASRILNKAGRLS
jgi:succinate dehydrogenase / fumarate reductase iron-sulfur subunit